MSGPVVDSLRPGDPRGHLRSSFRNVDGAPRGGAARRTARRGSSRERGPGCSSRPYPVRLSRLLAVIRPHSLGTWIVYLLVAPITLLTLANTAIGATDIQQLRDGGEDQVIPIVKVLERDDAGRPAKVVVDNTVDGVYHELDQLEGSLVGDSVRVRVYVPGAIMMSRTGYEHTGLLGRTLALSLLPLAFAALVVAAMQWRQVYGGTTPSYWGDRLGDQRTAAT